MTQCAHRDFLPRILGGALAVSVAIGVAIGLTNGAAAAQAATSNSDSSTTHAGAPITSAPSAAATIKSSESVPTAPPTVAPATAAAQAPRAAAAARPQLPPGQVWQCVIDGGRVFSDAPCGEHASIRRLSDLNVMDSPRQGDAYAYSYAPVHPPAETFAPAPSDDSDYADYPSADVPWVYGRARQHYIPRHDTRIHPHPHPHKN